MKELVIIGAGGFGRTVFWQCDADYGNGREWTIKGFLDDRPDILDGFGVPKPVLGDPFTIQATTQRNLPVCARRTQDAAQVCRAARRERRGIHQSLHRSRLPRFGEAWAGIIFERKVQVGSDTHIGNFVDRSCRCA